MDSSGHKFVDGRCVICWKHAGDCFGFDGIRGLHFLPCEGPPTGIEALRRMTSDIKEKS